MVGIREDFENAAVDCKAEETTHPTMGYRQRQCFSQFLLKNTAKKMDLPSLHELILTEEGEKLEGREIVADGRDW